MKLLESLKIDNKIVNYTENQTKGEAAFICNKLNPVKTNRELSTLVHNMCLRIVIKKTTWREK